MTTAIKLVTTAAGALVAFALGASITFDAEPDFAYAGAVSATETLARLNGCSGERKPWITIDGTYEEAVCRTAKQDMDAELVPCSQVTSAPVEPTVCEIWDDCDEG